MNAAFPSKSQGYIETRTPEVSRNIALHTSPQGMNGLAIEQQEFVLRCQIPDISSKKWHPATRTLTLPDLWMYQGLLRRLSSMLVPGCEN